MNTKTKLGAVLGGLSLCAAYALGSAPHIITPASAQTPPGRRWEYQCADGYNASTIMERANALGAKGWEMSGAVGSERVPGLWCFKRAL